MTASHKVELSLKDVLLKKAEMDHAIRIAILEFEKETGLKVRDIKVNWNYSSGEGYGLVLTTEVPLI